MNEYPVNWDDIAREVKEQAGWRCVRCGHPHESPKDRIPCDEKCDLSKHVEVSALKVACDSTPMLNVNTFRNPTTKLWRNQRQRVLTVHHMDGDKANVAWWNLVALCQVCHLQIQGKVVLEQGYYLEHSNWFKPYVAGYYAQKYLGERLMRSEVESRLDELLKLELAAGLGES